MSEDECPHLLDPRTCTLCNGRARREAQGDEWTLIPTVGTTAQYAGFCAGCGDPVEVGSEIFGWFREGSSTVWTHPDCEPHR